MHTYISIYTYILHIYVCIYNICSAARNATHTRNSCTTLKESSCVCCGSRASKKKKCGPLCSRRELSSLLLPGSSLLQQTVAARVCCSSSLLQQQARTLSLESANTSYAAAWRDTCGCVCRAYASLLAALLESVTSCFT